jgi:hypothetical protein
MVVESTSEKLVIVILQDVITQKTVIFTFTTVETLTHIIIILTLLAEYVDNVEYGVANSVIGCFLVFVENCRKQDGDEQYSKAN